MASRRIGGFFQSLAVANESIAALLRILTERRRAVPQVSLSEGRSLVRGDGWLLAGFRELACTRLAIVTGRPAEDVTVLLGGLPPGRFGGSAWSRAALPRWPSGAGRITFPSISRRRYARPVPMCAWRDWGWCLDCREKWNSVAFHWRGKRPQTVQSARPRTYKLLRGFADGAGMQLLEFDGGIDSASGVHRRCRSPAASRLEDRICRWLTLEMTNG